MSITYQGLHISLGETIPDNAFIWRNDPEIFQWCRQYTLLSPEHHKRWVEKIGTCPHSKMFAIQEITGQGPDFPIGVCGLTNIDWQARHAEFSIYINRYNQRRGFGREALYALLRHGFEDFNLNKIWGEVFDGNPGKQIYISLGLTMLPGHPQHYYRNGEYIDTCFAVILKKDWDVNVINSGRDIGEPQWGYKVSKSVDLEC